MLHFKQFDDKPILNKGDFEELDILAWTAIKNWHKTIDFSPLKNGLDYNHLTRFFLWDKVSRAIRIQLSNYNSTLEEKLYLSTKYTLENQITSGFSFAKEEVYRNLFNIYFKLKDRKRKRIFAPWYCKGLDNLYPQLTKSNKQYELYSFSRFRRQVIRLPKLKANVLDFNWAELLFRKINDGLQNFGIRLLKKDKKILLNQLKKQTVDIQLAEKYLKYVQPHLLIHEADNFPPSINYALCARKLGIPMLSIQHGLDCERYYLDEAYASHICVWGNYRKQRYESDSNYQPKIFVTGNPSYDKYSLPIEKNTSKDYLLWLTRPHNSEKCLSVSRSPQESINILNTLLSFLKANPKEKLIIKVHPFNGDNFLAQYLDNISEERVKIITNGSSVELIKNAKLIIVEDSTAGLEAMFFSKKIIHAHLIQSNPVMPFTKYQAALPGFSEEELINNITLCIKNTELSQSMQEGQRNFILQTANSLDGQASLRIIDVINKILNTSSTKN